MAKEKEKDVLLALYGSKAFVKIKNRLDSMGKILFSFVNISNPKENIDCYMEAEDFAVQIMTECSLKSSERLIRKIQTEKAKGDAYPKPVWTSPVGGNGTGNNGKPISRFFSIAPAGSDKVEVLFEAKVFPATKNSTGAFVAEKGAKALYVLRVPCSFNDLRKLALESEYLLQDYFSKKYTVDNMKSLYNTNDEDISSPIISDVPTDVPENAVTEPTEVNSKTVVLFATEDIVEEKETVKTCKVIDNDEEKRLIFLTKKIDTVKLSEFESYLSGQIKDGKKARFTAEVIEKGNDLYLKKFA